MPYLVKQFETQYEEMKKIVLKVMKQIMTCEGVDVGYIRKEVLDPYFKCFWTRRMAGEKRNYKQMIETTIEVARKVGVIEIIERIYQGLKDEN